MRERERNKGKMCSNLKEQHQISSRIDWPSEQLTENAVGSGLLRIFHPRNSPHATTSSFKLFIATGHCIWWGCLGAQHQTLGQFTCQLVFNLTAQLIFENKKQKNWGQRSYRV